MNSTNEFSFILKPSQYGVGVFTTHDISKGTHLALYGPEETMELRSIERNASDVPKIFHEYCINRGDKLICPKDFSAMSIGWYLNHSKDSNATNDEDYKWYASRDIKAGEEITIDYNSLNEPDEVKAEYYKKKLDS